MTHPAIEPVAGQRLGVPAHILQGGRDDHYVLRVVGDSMADEGILDGDFVIILRTDPLPGDVVVCLVGDDATLKRFYPEGDTVRLQPCNSKMKPIRVPAKDVKAQGVVVGMMRKFKRGEVAP